MQNGHLINREQCKQYILARSKEMRPGWDCHRVSKKALDDLNTKIRLLLYSAIQRHPSVGKTFKYII